MSSRLKWLVVRTSPNIASGHKAAIYKIFPRMAAIESLLKQIASPSTVLVLQLCLARSNPQIREHFYKRCSSKRFLDPLTAVSVAEALLDMGEAPALHQAMLEPSKASTALVQQIPMGDAQRPVPSTMMAWSASWICIWEVSQVSSSRRR